MTKEDIKKAIEIHVRDDLNCRDCPYFSNNTCHAQEFDDDVFTLVTKQEAEIAMLKAEKAKVVREFAEELKEHINNLAIEKYGDIACDTSYLTIDIDEFCDDIDELLEEIESEEVKE